MAGAGDQDGSKKNVKYYAKQLVKCLRKLRCYKKNETN